MLAGLAQAEKPSTAVSKQRGPVGGRKRTQALFGRELGAGALGVVEMLGAMPDQMTWNSR